MTHSPTSGALKKAQTLHQALVKTSSREREWNISTAKILYYLRRYDLWRFSVGAGVDSWEEYLKQPEVGIPKSRAEKLIRVYEFFIIEGGLDEADIVDAPVSGLDYIAKHHPNTLSPYQLRNLVSDAKALTQKDLKEKLYDDTNQPRTYTYVIMRKCNETGSLEKVHGIDSKLIEELVT